MKNLNKFEGKVVKSQNTVKGGTNGKGTKKAAAQVAQQQISLL